MPETPLTAADIIAAIHSNNYSVEDRVAFIRAMRDTTPGLVVVDPRDGGRIRASRSWTPEKLDKIINALENSEMWQRSAATTPKDIRKGREFGEQHKPLLDELRTYEQLVDDNVRYQYFLAVDKARAVVRAGAGISGEEALAIKPHLDLIARVVTRRRKKTEEPSAPVAQKQ